MKEKGIAFHAGVKGNNGVLVDNVRCKLLLPIKTTGDIRLRFYPTNEQQRQLQNMWEFSVEGEIKDSTGTVHETVKTEKAYRVYDEGEYTNWGQKLPSS
jgi:hypothetical protein